MEPYKINFKAIRLTREVMCKGQGRNENDADEQAGLWRKIAVQIKQRKIPCSKNGQELEQKFYKPGTIYIEIMPLSWIQTGFL